MYKDAEDYNKYVIELWGRLGPRESYKCLRTNGSNKGTVNRVVKELFVDNGVLVVIETAGRGCVVYQRRNDRVSWLMLGCFYDDLEELAEKLIELYKSGIVTKEEASMLRKKADIERYVSAKWSKGWVKDLHTQGALRFWGVLMVLFGSQKVNKLINR